MRRKIQAWLKTPAGIATVFGVMFVLSFAVFFWRFPNNFTQPNFYAEDGKVFAAHIVDHGFVQALFTTFNGYFIWGIYLLEGIGIVLNWILYGGQLVTLPQSLALVSYAFMALMATLPILILRRALPLMWLIVLAILVTFVPMPGSDYAIIGTIGNLKFAFLYLAVILLVYRNLAPAHSKGIWVADAALIVCAYTNVTVYALMPFALVRYAPLLTRDLKVLLHRLRHDASFISLVVMGVLLLPQLIVVKIFGIPKLPGYLDNPFNPERGVEIFAWRTYLFGFFYPLIKWFNNIYTIIAMVFLVVGLAFVAWKKKRVFIISLSLFAAFLGTFLFVLNRPGLSSFFFGYKASGPDQFFYPQTMLMYLAVIVALAALTARLRLPFKIGTAVALLALCLYGLPVTGTFGANNFMADDVGPVGPNMKAACLHTPKTSATLAFTVYPSADQLFTAPRDQVCTSKVMALTLQNDVSLGLTQPTDALVPFPGTETVFTQTFRSPKDNLDGIKLMVATYKAKPKSTFRFTLYDGTCRNKLAETDVPGGQLRDNLSTQILFPIQKHSAGQDYCFSLAPASPDRISPIALRLSAPGAYPEGKTVLNGQPSEADIIFSLLYGER